MKVIKRAQHLSWQDLGDHLIIIDSLQGKKVHHLNEVGSLIWKNLDGENTVLDIANMIESEFDTSKEVAKSDTEEFLDFLTVEKLVESEG